MKISVLGATGAVGGPAAFHIAMSRLADEILLVGGKRQNVLEHYAIDLSTAVSTLDISVKHGGYEDLAGSDIIINAAGSHQALAQDRSFIVSHQTELVGGIVRKIKQYAPEAIIINSVNPVDATTYATFLAGGFDRKKLVGYSINDTFRFREAIATELNVKVRQVDGVVVGEHGKTQVPLYSSVKVDGSPVTVAPEAQERIQQTIRNVLHKFESLKANRTAGWTCAVGLTQMTRAIVEDSNDVIPCVAILDGEYNVSNLAMSVPVVLGRSGIQKILEYDLTPEEQEGVHHSVSLLRGDMEIVTKLLAESIRA